MMGAALPKNGYEYLSVAAMGWVQLSLPRLRRSREKQ